MIIKWKDEYSCYDPTIDEQHKKMIDMINQMNSIVELGDKYDHYDELISLFEELKKYTSYHFTYEEKMFEETGYDSFNIKIQKLEHKSFVHKIAGINLYELDENQIGTAEEVLDFLSRWLDKHILGTDKRFGEYLREKAQQA